jgi:hypothetical protein
MRNFILSLLLAVFCTVLPANPQESRLSAPRLAVVFDAAGNALRPLWGIPGAATAGVAGDPGFPVTRIAMAPNQSFAVAASAADGLVRLLRFEAGQISASVLPGFDAADRIAISASGTAAAVYSQAGGTIAVVTGLPDRPGEVRKFGAPDSAALSGLAVSDDGAVVMAGTGDGSAWRIAREGASSKLALPPSVTALSFRARSHDAVVLTGEGLFLLRKMGTDVNFQLLNPAEISFGIAKDAKISDDGGRAYILTSDGSLHVLDIVTGSVRTTNCHCTPGALHATALPSIFRVTETSDPVLLLFDASADEPRIWFIPRPAEASLESTR